MSQLQLTSNHHLPFEHRPLHSRTSTQYNAPMGFTSIPSIQKRQVEISAEKSMHTDPSWALAQPNYGIVNFYVETNNYRDASLCIYLMQHPERIQANDYMVVLNAQNTSAVLKFDGARWNAIPRDTAPAFPCAATPSQRRNPASMTLNSSILPNRCVWVNMNLNGNVAAGYDNFETGQSLFAQVWDRRFNSCQTKIRYFAFGQFGSNTTTSHLTEPIRTRVYNIQSWASTDGIFMGEEV